MRKRYYTITYYTNGYESTQKKAGDNGYGITASGTKATAGRTIAAPESIPFGTKVYIEGIGTRVVEDRGGAIADGHIDVFVNDVNTARSLGKQTLLVEILN
jgi:3D (Asp-Asp-Asp) domain-containing protein